MGSLVTPQTSNMEPENALRKGEPSTNHQFLGIQPLVLGGVTSFTGLIMVKHPRIFTRVTSHV